MRAMSRLIKVTNSDRNLWKAYANELKKVFVQGFELSKSHALFMAPLSTKGISAGSAVDPAIMNWDVYRMGDMLLPASSPVFLPGPSYSQRLFRYLNDVQIPDDGDPKLKAKLENANKELSVKTDNFLTVQRDAMVSYHQYAEPGTTFDDWKTENYPPFAYARSQMLTAVQLVRQASRNLYGCDVDKLLQDKEKLSRAMTLEKAASPFNMPTSTAQAGTVIGPDRKPAPAPIQQYMPSYTIDNTYSESVASWVDQTAKNADLQGFKVEINAKMMTNSTWDDVGFNSKQVDTQDTAAYWPLFTTSYETSESNSAIVARVGIEETNHEAKVILTASMAKVFQINSGQWDIPDVVQEYPDLVKDAAKELTKSLVQVTHVLIGYNVALRVEFGADGYKQVGKLIKAAEENDGSCKLFGVDIGKQELITEQTSTNVNHAPSILTVEPIPKASFKDIVYDSAASSIIIPARADTFPTLIAVMGKRLQTPKSRLVTLEQPPSPQKPEIIEAGDNFVRTGLDSDY